MAQSPPEGIERLVHLAEAQERRTRQKEIATIIAVFVTLAFMAFVGYCIWSFLDYRAHGYHHAAAQGASSGSRP